MPREWFVPADLAAEAYADRALPIGHGQTISQPRVVEMMTELLDPTPGCKILEVGTGSGYQAAVLSRFTPHVYTVEIVEALYREVLPRLSKFGLDAEHVLLGDGSLGLERHAPFDRIIVT
ncbi:MAG TPA: protein-L-isoaspartate O-methyltransferase, partial [Chthoniobacterales bacterium]